MKVSEMTRKISLTASSAASIHEDGYVVIQQDNQIILLKPEAMKTLIEAYTSQLIESEGLGGK
jgi:hypothetical protein